MTPLCIFTLPVNLNGSVQHAACWYCSLLEIILIAAVGALLTAPATAGEPPFQIGLPPPSRATTPLSMTASTSSTDGHPGHLISAEGLPELPTSPAAPSPTPPPHPCYLHCPLTGKPSSQQRSQTLTEAAKAVETSRSQGRSQTTPSVRP